MLVPLFFLGLSLVCLLHAQRLVPNTRASIKSATAEQDRWTVMSCVVDTEADSVRCFPGPSVPKTIKGESGTSISLLVPVRIKMGKANGTNEGTRFRSPSNNALSYYFFDAYRRVVPQQSWHGHDWQNTLLDFN